MDIKCLDTYVLVEIQNKNPKFLKYIKQEFVIPELIMAEFYSVLLREYNEENTNFWYNEFKPFLKPTHIDTMINAVKFRRENRKKNLSFFDCIGYMFAKENKIKFVTGDKEFENLPNVEFIKA